MTSQVAIYNMNGIAIASDTVVTSTSDFGSKTTANSEKIYELGPSHKVLVMHYGGTTLNDVHHQFHLAEWSLSLSAPLPKLEDYINNYINWTNTTKRYHSSESETLEMKAVIYDHFKEIANRMDAAFESWEPLDGATEEESIAEITRINERIANEGLAYLKSLPAYSNMTETDAKVAIKAAGVDLSEMVSNTFDRFYTSPNLIKTMKTSASFALSREQSMPWDSFLAFTGYGSDDPFPGVMVLTCRSIYAGKFIYSKDEKIQIKPGTLNSEISRFAQDDAIEAFLRGYNNDILSGFSWAIEKHVRELMPNDSPSDLPIRVRDSVVDYVKSHSWRRYVNPILRQVSGMNLFALAELARTLVSIQATSSESKDGPVSVGGAIEVATIDRVNGVRWKHRLPR